jgi:hypothetical protein
LGIEDWGLGIVDCRLPIADCRLKESSAEWPAAWWQRNRQSANLNQQPAIKKSTLINRQSTLI